MTPQPSTSSTTQARNGRRSVAVLRRRALVAALGLAVLAAVVPVTAAHAAPQSPETDTHLTNPGGNPQPPADHDPTRPSTTRSRSRGRSTPGSAGPPTGPTRPPGRRAAAARSRSRSRRSGSTRGSCRSGWARTGPWRCPPST